MKRLLAILVLVVLGAAACSYGGTPADPAALTMGGTTVLTVAELEAELAFLDGNAQMAGALLSDPATGTPVALAGEVPGSYNPTAVAVLLNLHAQVELLDRVAASKGVGPDEAALSDARDALDPQLDQLGIGVDDLPASLVDALAVATAASDAINGWLADNPVEVAPVTDEDVRAFFEENRSQLPDEVVCVRHVLVAFETDAAAAEPGQAVEPTADQDAAARTKIDAVAARLAGGEDFAAVAIEVSDDPGSGAAGGDLGCGDPAQYVPEFGAAVAEQALGEVGEPVRTDFGYHIIEVTYRGEPTAELFDTEIRSSLEAQGAEDDSARFSELILAEAEAKALDVLLDPRFGSWDPAAGGVIPPAGAAEPPSTAVVDPLAGLDLP